MHEWLGLEWWRYAWGPAFAAGLVWLASAWKTNAETRGTHDARLDSRQEKELARLDAENDELRQDAVSLEEGARWWWTHCHEQRHLGNNTISRLGGTDADRLPELPRFEEPFAKR